MAGCGKSEKTSSSAPQDAAANPKETAAPPPAANLYIGSSVNVGSLQTTLTKVSTRKRFSADFMEAQAAEGGIYVVVQLKFKNIGTKPIGIFDMPSIRLVDDKGNHYSNDVNATMAASTALGDNSKVVSDLNPELSVTKVMAFEVSENAFAPAKWGLQIDDEATFRLITSP